MGSGGFDFHEARSAQQRIARTPQHERVKLAEPDAIKSFTDSQKVRRSLVTEEHPNPRPIAIGIDVTGSMRPAHEEFITGSTTHMLEVLHELGAQGDFYPQVFFAALADRDDRHGSMQLGHFESDNRMYHQLASFERGGGGGSAQMHEAGYLDYLFFLAFKTDPESVAKLGKKGHAFLIGDELPTKRITVREARDMYGVDIERDMGFDVILARVLERYHVTYLHTQTMAYGSQGDAEALETWRRLMPEGRVHTLDQTATGAAYVIATQVGIDEELMTRESALKHLVEVGTEAKYLAAVARAFDLNVNDFVGGGDGFERT